MEPKIESSVKYDDRRKELTRFIKETREAKVGDDVVGEIIFKSWGIYNQSGIKKILCDLELENKQLKKQIDSQSKNLESIPEFSEDLKDLKEKLIKLQKIDKAEKQINELQKKKEELKKVSQNIKDIKKAIGSRLKKI